MTDFGFTLRPTRALDLDSKAPDRFEKLLRKVPSYQRCFQCGACTATCTAGQWTDFNIRKVHAAFRRGEEAGLAQALRACMLCGKCTLVCPRGVNLRALVMQLRQMLEYPQGRRRV